MWMGNTRELHAGFMMIRANDGAARPARIRRLAALAFELDLLIVSHVPPGTQAPLRPLVWAITLGSSK